VANEAGIFALFVTLMQGPLWSWSTRQGKEQSKLYQFHDNRITTTTVFLTNFFLIVQLCCKINVKV
jgi:hypothetical protein